MNHGDPDALAEGWVYVLLEKLSKLVAIPERKFQCNDVRQTAQKDSYILRPDIQGAHFTVHRVL